jgi:hypothetical protein
LRQVVFLFDLDKQADLLFLGPPQPNHPPQASNTACKTLTGAILVCGSRQVVFLFDLDKQADLAFRMGRLNLLNPLRPDGGIQLAIERSVTMCA